MKKLFVNVALLSIAAFLLLTTCKTTEKIQIVSGDVAAIINVKEVERVERILAADDMRGRKAFTPDIDKAADFIVAEFKAAGLQTWNNSGNYRQEFSLAPTDLTSYGIEAVDEITEQKLANVVGVLPGKSKKDEYVIFSSHYDHLGVGKPVNGDSIYNGANDDAAGTTAVIMLAKYFKRLDNNERTIVFVAFTAEEVGGFGSQYFSRQINADKVMAMFNIEMIGTESKWGKNSAYITGYEKTDMGEILAKDLEGTGFTFYPDPYPTQQLFYRSDNATLASLGVPAHTISTSKMDVEPHYHQLTDHIETLDMGNMAQVIKAIALSSKSIVAGKETPTRVKVEKLR
jgi:Zn-dependent M28 family amino/carboxypeptidase